MISSALGTGSGSRAPVFVFGAVFAILRLSLVAKSAWPSPVNK